MRSVVVTGVGLLSAAGSGTEPFRRALRAGRPLGEETVVALPAGRKGALRHAHLGPWDPGEHLTPRARRKMVGEAQAVSSAFLTAMAHSGADRRPVEPERLGTYLGSGFGCMQTTEDFLKDLFTEGMATVSPFLFAESLANSPLGHVAILLDARGPSIGVACGDASASAALALGFRDIRKGRVDRALCGGYELSTGLLRDVISRLAGRSAEPFFIGDGVAVLVLEDEQTARRGGAPILAKMTGVGEAGDPGARSTDWSHDPVSWAGAFEAALRMAGERGREVRRAFLHQPASAGARRAERVALERVAAGSERMAESSVHPVFGSFAAAGGFPPLAAVLDCSESAGRVLVSAGSWGGSTMALVFESPEG